jgi:hypothetical protein
MKKITILLLFAAGLLLINGCYYDKEQLLTPPKTGTSYCLNYSFAADVSPVIQTSCNTGSGCHATGSTNGPGALVTFTEIKNASTQVQASILAGRMPLGTSMSTTNIQIINCWINNGSLNN